MYEVVCPDCARRFDAAEGAESAVCPTCRAEMDLVSETVARNLGIDPARGVPVRQGRSRTSLTRSARERPAWVDEVDAPQAPAPAPIPVASEDPPEVEVVATPDEQGLVEVPCPVCSGPLLVATTDREGVCPHCDRLLEFEIDSGNGSTPERPPTGPTHAPGSSFDAVMPITSASAPMVEVRWDADVAPSPRPSPDMPAAPVAAAPAAGDEPPVSTKTTRQKTAAPAGAVKDAPSTSEKKTRGSAERKRPPTRKKSVGGSKKTTPAKKQGRSTTGVKKRS